MAIRIITGKPGAGKTFYAVKHLVDNYFRLKNGKYQKLKRTNKDTNEIENITIITNIKRLKLAHTNLDSLMKKLNLSVKDFFTETTQKKISEKNKIVYFIDECQQYFDKRFYDKNVFYYFQTHRHLGHDIYLITQNIQLIPIQLKELAEIEIHAVPRNISFFGEFKYSILSNNEKIDKKLLKKDKKIFKIFKSYSNKEIEKIKNPLIKYLAAVLVIFAIAGYLFYNTFITRIGKEKPVTFITEDNQNANYKEKKYEKRDVFGKEIKNNKIKDLTPIRLDYVICKKEIWVIEPVTNIIIPIRKFPFKIAIDKYGRRIEIIAFIPSYLLLEKKKTSRTIEKL